MQDLQDFFDLRNLVNPDNPVILSKNPRVIFIYISVRSAGGGLGIKTKTSSEVCAARAYVHGMSSFMSVHKSEKPERNAVASPDLDVVNSKIALRHVLDLLKRLFLATDFKKPFAVDQAVALTWICRDVHD